MRTYHPESWSVQARNLSNHIYSSYHLNKLTLEECEKIFSKSYRHPLIRKRAAKRFGRLVRRNKK